MKMLKFSEGRSNAKLVALQDRTGKKVYTFSLLSGHSCPFAKDCLSKVVSTEDGPRIKDGPHTKFRCFSASQEVFFPAVYNQRKHNFDTLKACDSTDEMVELIESSMPKCGIVRLHVGGEFFNQKYFDAWVTVANNHSDKIVYAYTKSLPYWIKRDIPENFRLTASFGGTHDHLIDDYDLRYSKVVFSEDEAKQLNLEIDHDDMHAYEHGPSFALLIHGTQPAQSEASKAVVQLNGKGSYRRKSGSYTSCYKKKKAA